MDLSQSDWLRCLSGVQGTSVMAEWSRMGRVHVDAVNTGM